MHHSVCSPVNDDHVGCEPLDLSEESDGWCRADAEEKVRKLHERAGRSAYTSEEGGEEDSDSGILIPRTTTWEVDMGHFACNVSLGEGPEESHQRQPSKLSRRDGSISGGIIVPW